MCRAPWLTLDLQHAGRHTRYNLTLESRSVLCGTLVATLYYSYARCDPWGKLGARYVGPPWTFFCKFLWISNYHKSYALYLSQPGLVLFEHALQNLPTTHQIHDILSLKRTLPNPKEKRFFKKKELKLKKKLRHVYISSKQRAPSQTPRSPRQHQGKMGILCLLCFQGPHNQVKQVKRTRAASLEWFIQGWGQLTAGDRTTPATPRPTPAAPPAFREPEQQPGA